MNHLNIVQKLADIQSDVILKKLLLREQKMIVRVYMIEGFDLASRDIGGFSDPYLKLRLGSKKVSDRKNYIMDEPNPKFCKHWDFTTTFPGCPMLFIDAMDYDDLFGDDLIGGTTVDLEDRYFLPEWRALHDKPVEYRQIYHPSSSVSQGQLKLWIEINPADVPPDEEVRVWEIQERPPIEMQMRVCVFDTRDIKMMDDEGTSDVFIRAYFDSRHGALETDTHYRCQTGKASFNYRLNYKVTMPRKDYRFTVQAYDRDFFKSNDIIGSAMINLKQAFQDVDLTKRPLQINKKYYEKYMRKDGDKPLEFEQEEDSFWLPMLSKDKDGKIEDNGHVRIRIDITTMEHAEKNKIGSAREEPNNDPFLPPPVGRLTFSFNPCEMYKQLVGPAMRRKIAIWCCVTISSILCVMILYYLVPIVIGGIITNWIMPK